MSKMRPTLGEACPELARLKEAFDREKAWKVAEDLRLHYAYLEADKAHARGKEGSSNA